jgi:hypothetical protein
MMTTRCASYAIWMMMTMMMLAVLLVVLCNAVPTLEPTSANQLRRGIQLSNVVPFDNVSSLFTGIGSDNQVNGNDDSAGSMFHNFVLSYFGVRTFPSVKSSKSSNLLPPKDPGSLFPIKFHSTVPQTTTTATPPSPLITTALPPSTTTTTTTTTTSSSTTSTTTTSSTMPPPVTTSSTTTSTTTTATTAAPVNLFRIVFTYDNFPTQIGWYLIGPGGIIIFQDPGSVSTSRDVVNRTATLSTGYYTFVVIDTYSDGLNTPANYVATLDGANLFNGTSGPFYSRSNTFIVGTPGPATGSNQTVQVLVEHDDNPRETGWILFGAASGAILSQDAGAVFSKNLQVNVSATVAPDKFLFIITDSIGDGLSDIPTGDYQVNVNGTEVRSDGGFPFTFEKVEFTF